MKGRPMLRVTRHRLIMCVLVVVILIIIPRGGLFAVDFTRGIILFKDNTLQAVKDAIVTHLTSFLGASIIHNLSFINGLSMQFPLNNQGEIDQSILDYLALVSINLIVIDTQNVVYDDLVGLMDLET